MMTHKITVLAVGVALLLAGTAYSVALSDVPAPKVERSLPSIDYVQWVREHIQCTSDVNTAEYLLFHCTTHDARIAKFAPSVYVAGRLDLLLSRPHLWSSTAEPDMHQYITNLSTYFNIYGKRQRYCLDIRHDIEHVTGILVSYTHSSRYVGQAMLASAWLSDNDQGINGPRFCDVMRKCLSQSDYLVAQGISLAEYDIGITIRSWVYTSILSALHEGVLSKTDVASLGVLLETMDKVNLISYMPRGFTFELATSYDLLQDMTHCGLLSGCTFDAVKLRKWLEHGGCGNGSDDSQSSSAKRILRESPGDVAARMRTFYAECNKAIAEANMPSSSMFEDISRKCSGDIVYFQAFPLTNMKKLYEHAAQAERLRTSASAAVLSRND